MDSTDGNSPRIERAYLNSYTTGVVDLTCDWTAKTLPPLRWGSRRRPLRDLRQAPPSAYAERSGYSIAGRWLTFLIVPARYPYIDWKETTLFVAGDFNQWNPRARGPSWRLEPAVFNGRDVLRLSIDRQRIDIDTRPQFKFVTHDNHWLEVPADAPNRVTDQQGNINHAIEPARTGSHVFQFTAPDRRQDDTAEIHWVGKDGIQTTRVTHGPFFLGLSTNRALGAHCSANATTFTLFAPRATRVEVVIYRHRGSGRKTRLVLNPNLDGSWIGSHPRNLHGWYYHLHVSGDHSDPLGLFDEDFPILDPYALAAVGPAGPGIIWDRQRLPAPPDPFTPPAWHDLVICEAHVRDLTAQAPVTMSARERLGFTGLTRWIEDEGCYLRELGINALELLPIQEIDVDDPRNYQWGYMTNNFFAPSSCYATKPGSGSQLGEFRDLVQACHDAGIAVILDVVYNHVGVPGHLQFIDKEYYFEVDPEGGLINWSGCGNTLRADAPMSRRLIIDSLTHLVTHFGVDGFRFDLAELLGVPVLEEIEHHLKAVKPGIILIAEPWSFRGHIGHALKPTGFAFWNDGYREFVPKYLRGQESADGLRYFLSGALENQARFPAQTVNYTESHDDHCWLDRITENSGHDGTQPTLRDRTRTHLMAAILFASVGLPMIAAGQDFLRTKKGHDNTYLRGDLNQLDYRRRIRFSDTHDYVRSWIRFRRSPAGQPLRLDQSPGSGYFRAFTAKKGPALALLYNADRSLRGAGRLLFAINPLERTSEIPVRNLDWDAFTQIADHGRFDPQGLTSAHLTPRKEDGLQLPPMSCGLWIAD